MNNLNINLNLLKALSALLHEKHVSNAGERLGITQSAMSISLKQLREHYRDELLIRAQQGQMRLTPFAETLIQPVHHALQQIEIAFTGQQAFDPKTSNRTFHIGTSDYIAFVLLPKLMLQLNKIAPNIKIIQHGINYLDGARLFEEDNLDLVIGQFSKAGSTLKTCSLFKDKSIIVADKNHPAFKIKKLTTKEMTKYPQVFVSLEGQADKNSIADMIRKKGHEVDISLMTPHTLVALFTLPGTTMITNTVERLAEPFIKHFGLAKRDTPYPMPNYHAQLYWHAQHHKDPGHQFLRELIKEICA